LIVDPELASFGSWLEQLVAESSGKEGKGIVPVDGEPLAAPGLYGPDRLFVRMRRSGGSQIEALDRAVGELLRAGHPVLTFDMDDPYDLGAEFYRWEMAVALACSALGVNAFDQPDVQDAKQRTQAKIDSYYEQGSLNEGQPLWEGEGVKIYGAALPVGLKRRQRVGLRDILAAFLAQGREGEYVALNAYLARSEVSTNLLERIRVAIRDRTRLATTVGFGPRFLHSTGQLHKGGPNTGLFLEITAEPVEDVEIPGERLSFGTLEHAQALGDLEALLARGRRALRVHLKQPEGLEELVKAVEGFYT
jgi:hypothetical protein